MWHEKPTQAESGRTGANRRQAQRHSWLVVRWCLHLAGFLLALVVVALACLPTSPGEQQYLIAASQLKSGLRYDLALARYADASEAAPRDPRPLCLAGETRALQQEWTAAAAAYARCAALGPRQATSWIELGDARQVLGQTSGAEDAWEHAAQLGDADALRRLGLAAEERGDVSGAMLFWQKLPGGDPQALAELGMLALWQGDTTLARRDFALAGGVHDNAATNMLVADGFPTIAGELQNEVQTQGNLGHAFLAANLPALAVRPFQRAVALGPRNGQAHAFLGWTLLLLGQPAKAGPEIRLGLTLSPNDSFSWFAAGEAALVSGQPGDALDYFLQGSTLDLANPVFYAEAAQAALAQHDYTEALSLLQTTSSLSDQPTYTISLLSVYVSFHLGLDDGSARKAAIAAVERWPNDETIQFQLAEIFVEANEGPNAYYAAETAKSLDPTDPGPYILLGTQAENEGNYVVAALDFRIALALRPSGPLAPQARILLAPISDVSA
jgi:tetratricopeptide (TPR) repeat protein